jgi:hypothetical protein
MDRSLTFDTFWNWLVGHPNCILRAGTDDVVIFDDDDLYWHFTVDPGGERVVEVLRGKRLVGEMIVEPQRVSYVQPVESEQPDEFPFELVSSEGNDRQVAYFFVLTHDFDGENAAPRQRVH